MVWHTLCSLIINVSGSLRYIRSLTVCVCEHIAHCVFCPRSEMQTAPKTKYEAESHCEGRERERRNDMLTAQTAAAAEEDSAKTKARLDGGDDVDGVGVEPK